MPFIGPWGAQFNQLSSDTVSPGQLGSRVETADGRSFRLALNSSAAMEAGNLYQAPGLEGNHQNIAVASAAAIGALQVTVTLGATAATAGQYAGGYLVVNDETGEGHTYLIRSNPAAALSSSLTLDLAEPIKVALVASTTEVCLIPNLYNKPVISATAQTGTPVGIAPFAVAASVYCWLQTQGVCSGLADEAYSGGAALTVGTGDTGALEALDAAGEVQVGVAIQTAVDGEFRAVYMMLP